MTKDTEINIRLSAEEKSEIEQAARAESLSMSAWIRRIVLLTIRRKPK